MKKLASHVPERVADVPTPALVLDVAAMDRNIRRMADAFEDGPCRLRPHVKAHKTPEIARRQLAAGSCSGLTCATVSEAETVADLCDDILIANEIIGPGKCERLAALASRVRTTVAVDSMAGLLAAGRAATRARVTVGVVVDLNVGQMRCGVSPGQEALELARSATSVAGVALRGLMGYEGHVVGLQDRSERAARARVAMEGLVETARLLRKDGLPCEVVSAGGTGTYDISGHVTGITEIQAGSYVLMDTDYGRLDIPFEQAFWVLGTVISRPDAKRIVADCGHKSTTKDHGLPGVKDIEGASVVSLNDEHATIRCPQGCDLGVGDQVFLLPSHTDPTINLHDVFYVIDRGCVVDVWPITARGYSEQRRAASDQPIHMGSGPR
jgi:D-serine deaminase-like pyridoxal phosphate-dependent protein